MKTCIIFNPTAQGDKARLFQAQLSLVAGEATLKPTSGPGSARSLASEAVRERFEIIAAAGGDGTVNEVLNGIADAPEGFAQARLAVLPIGTTNVFARELRIPLNVTGAWEVVRRAHEKSIDLPYADAGGARRYFAQLAGAGFDARAVELVSWKLKKSFGYFAYVVAALRALRTKIPPILVRAGDRTVFGELVLVGNGKLYGGSFNLFPAADLQDGVLEVVVYPRVTMFTVMRAMRGVLTGDFHAGGDTMQLQSQRVELTCEAAMPFELDGENVGHLPVTFGIVQRALRVIVP